MSEYTTKVTRTRGGYLCRVSRAGRPVVQAKVKTPMEIGGAFRDLLRTLDKLGGDRFTSAARHRNGKNGNRSVPVKHQWL